MFIEFNYIILFRNNKKMSTKSSYLHYGSELYALYSGPLCFAGFVLDSEIDFAGFQMRALCVCVCVGDRTFD